MDLQTAAKRYEEVRRFWAREIAIKLSTGNYRAHIAALRWLADKGEPRPSDNIMDAMPRPYASQHSRATSSTQLCRSLLKASLVTRTKRGYAYWYALSELGALVLEYIPRQQYANEGEAIPRQQYANEGEKRIKPRKKPALTAPNV